MKCKICGNRTTWDVSYGLIEFIVCDKCFNELAKHTNREDTLTAIQYIGEIIREKRGK